MCTPPLQGGEKKLVGRGEIYRESCKLHPRQSVHPQAEQESNFVRKFGQIWTVEEVI